MLQGITVYEAKSGNSLLPAKSMIGTKNVGSETQMLRWKGFGIRSGSESWNRRS
jgi:hypothetical protein